MAIEFVTVTDATGVSRQVAADLVGSDYWQASKLAYGTDGSATLVDSGAPLPTADATVAARLPTALGLGALQVIDGGTYGYAAGTSTGTVDVPAGARLKRVTLLANAALATTIVIGGGATITVPAGASFDEQVPGAAVGADVVIGGAAPQTYYVSWVS